MRFFSAVVAAILMFDLVKTVGGEEASKMECKAVEFKRHYLTDETLLSKIREVGDLSGRHKPDENVHVLGWFEYEFEVPQKGWYELFVNPSAENYEFLVDGKLYFHRTPSGPKAANLWLEAGRHTVRIQRFIWWTGGFGPITALELKPSEAGIEHRLRVEPRSDAMIFRKGEKMNLDFFAGGLTEKVTVNAIVRESGQNDGGETFAVEFPASENVVKKTLAIPCAREGSFQITFLDGEKTLAPEDAPPLDWTVVDASLQARPGGEAPKTLLKEIDCATTSPDFAGGGETRVIHRSFGSYRESGDVGYQQHQNSTDPCWFAYRFEAPEAQKQYVIEVDYPDDALRTYCIAIREGVMGAYPTAGGVDSGGEFSLTYRMQTQTIYHWAHSKDLRVVVVNATDGLRAAAAKIRIFKEEGEMPPMNLPVGNGRSFANWYEEGGSYLGLYGGVDWQQAKLQDYLLAADRWARSVAYMGGDTLWPTLVVYQFGLYPSHYNVLFTAPFTMDVARAILLKCEKYGLKGIFEFHPEARDLSFPLPDGSTSQDNFLVNREGVVGNKYPFQFSPLHPRNQQWYLGMIGEFVDRYKDSPAFKGVSLRLMAWCNPTLNNFQSLDWGYEDYTVNLFEKETGAKIPVADGDPQRFHKRYEWLMANAKEKWIQWRCEKIADLYRRIRDRVRQARPDLQVFTNVVELGNETLLPRGGRIGEVSRLGGVDFNLLSKIDGVCLVNIGSYGRRPDQQPIKVRDQLLKAVLRPMRQAGGGASFLFGSMYFEATEPVVTPESLGYPAGTKRNWMSGVVNPAGRHYLERWSMALAEDDATFLADGGNAYTLGQPLLREFLQEYRRLPPVPFILREDAQDPVAVRELHLKEDFLFYAVNRERFPEEITLQFKGNGKITRLSTGEKVPLENQALRLKLEPYQLMAFQADSTMAILKASTEVSEVEVKRAHAQVAWLERLADDVEKKAAGDQLTPEQVAQLKEVRTEARTALDQGHLWRARMDIERGMLEIYARCNGQPPYLQDNGSPVTPPGAIKASDLIRMVKDTNGLKLVASEDCSPNWTGEQLLMSTSRPLTVELSLEAEGRYRLSAGQLLGGDFGPVEVAVNGEEMGTLGDSRENLQGIAALLTKPIVFKKGTKVQLDFLPREGKGMALSYLKITPIFSDIMALRWNVIGPFKAQGEKPEENLAQVFPPEEKRDFDSEIQLSDGKKIKWTPLEGMVDYINFEPRCSMGNGVVSYAATYLHSDEAHRVRFSYSMDYWMKIWLNGRLVKDFAPHAGGAPSKGQFTLDVDLQAGWNELLVKVASGSLGNGFWMAVSNPGDLRFSAKPGNLSGK